MHIFEQQALIVDNIDHPKTHVSKHLTHTSSRTRFFQVTSTVEKFLLLMENGSWQTSMVFEVSRWSVRNNIEISMKDGSTKHRTKEMITGHFC